MISKPLATTQSKWVMLFEDSIALAWGDARMFVYEKLTIEVSLSNSDSRKRLGEKLLGQGSNAAAGAVSENSDHPFTGEGGGRNRWKRREAGVVAALVAEEEEEEEEEEEVDRR